jgi:hypothetical protein
MYTREDLLLTHLWLFLAVQAARSGEIDIDSRLDRYREFVSQLALQMPPLPPLLQKEVACASGREDDGRPVEG